jgi:hypothetical protein
VILSCAVHLLQELRASALDPLRRLRAAAPLYGRLLQACGGSVTDAVSALGGEFIAPHLDAARVEAFFGPGGLGLALRLLDVLREVATTGITPPVRNRNARFDAWRWKQCGRPHADDDAAVLMMYRSALSLPGHILSSVAPCIKASACVCSESGAH